MNYFQKSNFNPKVQLDDSRVNQVKFFFKFFLALTTPIHRFFCGSVASSIQKFNENIQFCNETRHESKHFLLQLIGIEWSYWYWQRQRVLPPSVCTLGFNLCFRLPHVLWSLISTSEFNVGFGLQHTLQTSTSSLASTCPMVFTLQLQSVRWALTCFGWCHQHLRLMQKLHRHLLLDRGCKQIIHFPST